MRHLTAACLFLGLALWPAVVSAGEKEPYVGVRFEETKDGKVKATSLDPKAIAWQMGFRNDDVVKSIDVGTGSKAIKSASDAKVIVGKVFEAKEETEYTIVIERRVGSSTRPVERTIKGKILANPDRPWLNTAKMGTEKRGGEKSKR